MSKSDIKLLHGDCLKLMREIETGSIDMILTDPPYGTTQCAWDTVIPLNPMWHQLKRIIKNDGATCLFGSEPFSSRLRLSNITNYKYDWIWRKSPFNFLNSKHQPLRDSENISIFYKKIPFYKRQKIKKIKWKTHGQSGESETLGKHRGLIQRVDDYAFPTTVIDHVKKEDTNLVVHPTQKPVALLEYLIKTYTKEGETVLDFTMGSGSTGVACKNLNRKFIGIELDDDYFKIASKRIGDA